MINLALENYLLLLKIDQCISCKRIMSHVQRNVFHKLKHFFDVLYVNTRVLIAEWVIEILHHRKFFETEIGLEWMENIK